MLVIAVLTCFHLLFWLLWLSLTMGLGAVAALWLPTAAGNISRLAIGSIVSVIAVVAIRVLHRWHCAYRYQSNLEWAGHCRLMPMH